MAMKIPIKHTQSKMIKNGHYGFSWTYLFFGFWVPIIRGEIKMGLIYLLIDLVPYFTTELFQDEIKLGSMDSFYSLEDIGPYFIGFSIGLFIERLIISFLYNKQYMTRMLTRGWELAGTEEQNVLARQSLNIIK